MTTSGDEGGGDPTDRRRDEGPVDRPDPRGAPHGRDRPRRALGEGPARPRTNEDLVIAAVPRACRSRATSWSSGSGPCSRRGWSSARRRSAAGRSSWPRTRGGGGRAARERGHAAAQARGGRGRRRSSSRRPVWSVSGRSRRTRARSGSTRWCRLPGRDAWRSSAARTTGRPRAVISAPGPPRVAARARGRARARAPLGGGCALPLGAFAAVKGDSIRLAASWPRPTVRGWSGRQPRATTRPWPRRSSRSAC